MRIANFLSYTEYVAENTLLKSIVEHLNSRQSDNDEYRSSIK